MKNLLDSQRESFHARVIIIEGDGESSVLDLLKVEHEVLVADDSVHRGMITSIDGLQNSDSEFWRYAVGNTKIPKPASKTIPGKGDLIIWWFGIDSEPPKLQT